MRGHIVKLIGVEHLDLVEIVNLDSQAGLWIDESSSSAADRLNATAGGSMSKIIWINLQCCPAWCITTSVTKDINICVVVE